MDELVRYALRFVWILVLGSCLGGRASAQDEEEKKLGWFDTAELSFVATNGNAKASTLGFRNTLLRVWPEAQFNIEAGGLRAESTFTTLSAVGTSIADFELVEESENRLTAENYFLRGKYDRQINERFFWYASAGWDRNQFAGIQNRYFGAGGVGNVWFDNDTARFRTDYGLSVTRQEDVVGSPDATDTFLGARLSSDYWRQLTSNTGYGNLTILDENLNETSDLRIDMTNYVTVSMTERLALKVSHQLLLDNQPSLVAVPLFLPGGDPSGENVFVEADSVDSIFTIALVMNF